jgi:hypothetical protein
MLDAWLIVGLPTYSRWHEYKGKRSETPRQVYLLEKQKDVIELKPVEDWWPLN